MRKGRGNQKFSRAVAAWSAKPGANSECEAIIKKIKIIKTRSKHCLRYCDHVTIFLRVGIFVHSAVNRIYLREK